MGGKCSFWFNSRLLNLLFLFSCYYFRYNLCALFSSSSIRVEFSLNLNLDQDVSISVLLFSIDSCGHMVCNEAVFELGIENEWRYNTVSAQPAFNELMTEGGPSHTPLSGRTFYVWCSHISQSVWSMSWTEIQWRIQLYSAFPIYLKIHTHIVINR